jgi:hypothetical protein
VEAQLTVAIIAGAVALLSAAGTIGTSVWNASRTNSNARAIKGLELENERRKEANIRESEISVLREPLARAAYDLQSRLYNMLKRGVLTFIARGDERERAYVIDNTVFLIAQYLCWTELVRREIQFINLGKDGETRRLQRLQDAIYDLWGTSRFSSLFRIFAGEQRAIGEALAQVGRRGPECMGYGAFVKEFERGKDPLLDALRDDVKSLPAAINNGRLRLTEIQHALIDLLDMLDPEYLRFPRERRSKAEED